MDGDSEFLYTLVTISSLLSTLIILAGLFFLLSFVVKEPKAIHALFIVPAALLTLFTVPWIFLFLTFFPILPFWIAYISLAVFTFMVIKQTKPIYSIGKSFGITLSITILTPVILYGISTDFYSKEGYIKKAHKVLGIDPIISKRANVYRYYDNIKYCTYDWKDPYPELTFSTLRLFGRQKHLVMIDDQHIVFNRFGKQIKKIGNSLPNDSCGG